MLRRYETDDWGDRRSARRGRVAGGGLSPSTGSRRDSGRVSISRIRPRELAGMLPDEGQHPTELLVVEALRRVGPDEERGPTDGVAGPRPLELRRRSCRRRSRPAAGRPRRAVRSWATCSRRRRVRCAGLNRWSRPSRSRGSASRCRARPPGRRPDRPGLPHRGPAELGVVTKDVEPAGMATIEDDSVAAGDGDALVGGEPPGLEGIQHAVDVDEHERRVRFAGRPGGDWMVGMSCGPHGRGPFSRSWWSVNK